MRTNLALLLVVLVPFLGCKKPKEEPPPPAPTLASITPPVGDLAGGQSVTIRGQNLVGASSVTFGAAQATSIVVNADGNSLRCVTPPNPRGLVSVSVTTPGGTATSSGAFTYATQVSVTTLEPARVPANQAALVTLRGKGLVAPLSVKVVGADSVGVPAPVMGTGTDMAAQINVPALAVGTYQVVITNGENQVGTSAQDLTVTEPVRVTLVDPDSGFADDTLLVRLEGTGFTGVTQVLFGTGPCTDLLVENDKNISCRAPSGTPGAVTVTVRRTAGDETAVPNGFTYYSSTDSTVRVLYADPRVGDAAGVSTTNVYATGLNVGNPTITIGGANAQVVEVVAGKHARVNVPSHMMGNQVVTKVPISVTAGGNTDTKQNAFTYYVKPVISSLNPVKGGTVGGDQVTILGDGFTEQGLRVTFDGIPATEVSWLNNTRLSCKAPPHAAAFVNVVVYNQFDLSLTASSAFQYVEAVRITALDPPKVSIAGGTLLEATGSGFVVGAMQVELDGTPINNPQVINGNLMRFVMPRHAATTTMMGAQLTVRYPAGIDQDLSEDTVSVTYEDKTVSVGGAAGGAINRNISVSVVRQDNGLPVSGATVFLGGSYANATYRGATDENGMLVLSGADLHGPQTITAARTGFEYQTFVAVDSAEVTFALLPQVPQAPSTPLIATVSGQVGNWAAAGYPLGAQPGQVKRVAVVWVSEPDQGISPLDPGRFNIVSEEACDVTIDGINNPLPASFTLNATPNSRIALMAAVYFYDSKDGVCAPGNTQNPSQEGEGFIGVTAGAVGLLTDVLVSPGTNPGANVLINRTVTDGMRVNLVGAPTLGGVGLTGRTVDAILDVGASGVFTFFNPLDDTATFQFNMAAPAAPSFVYDAQGNPAYGGEFFQVIPTAVPAPGGDLKYILHGITARPDVQQGQMVGLAYPRTEVWKRGVQAAEENLDSWFQMPAGLAPASGGTLQDRKFSWSAWSMTPSFTTLDIAEIDAQGNVVPRWSVLIPGTTTASGVNVNEFRVPEVAGAQNVEDLHSTNNLWQLGGYKIFDADGFDYHNHDNSMLGEPHRQALVLSDANAFTLP